MIFNRTLGTTKHTSYFLVRLTGNDQFQNLFFTFGYNAGQNVEDNTATIKRILHSIKGEAGIIGINDIHEICYTTESVLAELTDNSAITDIVLKVKDWIQDALKYITVNSNTEKKTSHTCETKKLKALIVDDMPVCRKAIEMLLGDFFNCQFAENGKQAFELYAESLQKQNPYDLITLDINMPEMNGHVQKNYSIE